METNASVGEAIESLRLKWGWILALGIAQIVIGVVALGDTVTLTFISVLVLGWLLIVSAIVHIVHLMRHREVSSFWHILNIIIDFAAGLYLIARPGIGAIILTLVLSAFLMATGIMRFIAAFSGEPPHKFWVIVNAVVAVLLGILLWVHWPWSGFWFIGFAVGIELILRGWSWVMLATLLRRPAQPTAPAAPA
jgi:uncharacterized membrane protein HdeD (DUF308 family)